MFHFSTYRPSSFKHLSHRTVQKASTAAIVASVVATCRSGRSFLINNAFSAASKLRTPNMYCWSRKTLVATQWTHLRVNLICSKSFCPQKKEQQHAVRYGTTSMATSPYLMFINDVTVTSS